MATERVEDWLTADEFLAAWHSLSVADRERLRRYSVHLVGSEAAEVLRQESIYKALSEERQCRRDCDVVTFLAGTMRSLVWSGRKAAKRRPTVSLEDVGCAVLDGGTDDGPHEQLVQTHECQRIREEVLALFEDDPDARLLVEGIMEGLEGQELCELVSIGTGELATKRRLIRRRIDRAFPNGWHHDS